MSDDDHGDRSRELEDHVHWVEDKVGGERRRSAHVVHHVQSWQLAVQHPVSDREAHFAQYQVQSHLPSWSDGTVLMACSSSSDGSSYDYYESTTATSTRSDYLGDYGEAPLHGIPRRQPVHDGPRVCRCHR
jgi:hypothetical protein